MSDALKSILGVFMLLFLGLAVLGEIIFTQAIAWVLVFLILPIVILQGFCQMIVFCAMRLKRKFSKKAD